ncbi:PKD-like family lipoprotein [Pedobacter hiemivivus]|nr:PKD-like family lipoprotein [Pedobacter hiemivivus]
MMKYLYQVFCIMALTIILQACKKEDKNFTYQKVNQILVKTSDSVFTIKQLDKLKITPQLEESVPGSGPYTYEWSVYSTKNYQVNNLPSKSITLSKEKNLDKIIDLSPDSYYLQYTITDTRTGIKTFKRFSLTVNGTFYEGWFVMSNKAGKAMVSFIRKDDEVFVDPIRELNGAVLQGKGLSVYSAVISKMTQINVFTDQGVYRFNADDLKLNGNTGDLFLANHVWREPYYTLNSINTDQFIVNDGEVYATLTPNFGDVGKYSEKFSGPSNGYNAFPYLISGSKFYTVFYDNLNKRFLQTSYNDRTLNTFGTTVGAAYDLNNVGKTMIAGDKGAGSEYYAIMKDNNGYYFYSIMPAKASPAESMQPIKNSPDIELATSFSSSSVVKQIYYGAANKVYVYDILANASRLVYQFPENTKIKDLEMLKNKAWSKVVDASFDKRLVVATYNGVEGEVYYLDLSPTGDVTNNTYSKKIGGFGDIVQINYRNPNI